MIKSNFGWGRLKFFKIFSFLFLLGLSAYCTCASADVSERVRCSPAPFPPIEKTIEKTNDIFDLIWRHEEKGALEKLEQILKAGIDLNSLKDKDKLGGCSPMANAVFATSANPNLSSYSDIRKHRYDHVPLLLKYGANVKRACSERQGETPLHFAAKKGDINLIYLLVENGADVNARDSMGRTPLFYVFTGNPEAANLLLYLGADVEAVGGNRTILEAAVDYTDPRIMEILLQHGADPLYMGQRALLYAKERFKDSPSRCLALMEHYQKLCEEFLKTHPNGKPFFSPPPKPAKQLLPEKIDPSLVTAVKAGDLEQAKELLAQTKEPNVVSTEGDMPLHLAIKAARVEIVKLLLENGAMVDLRNADGQPPIVLAKDSPEMIQLLLEHGARVDRLGPYGQTALQGSQNIQAMELLLKNGADINREANFGFTPLWSAVASKDNAKVEFLLARGANVNIQSEDGNTPLHQAVTDKNQALVELLLSKGANPNLKSMLGFTPYDVAVSQAEPDLIALLSKSGGQYGDKEKVIRQAIQASSVPFVEKLLNEGVSPDLDLDKNSPLLLQAVYAYPQNKEMLRLLIARGATVKFTDGNQRSLLHLIQDPEILELLLQKGLDANAVDDQRNTPLHIAASRADVEAVRVFLKYKAFSNARDGSGLTPLERALRGPQDQRPACGPPPDFAIETPKYLATISLLLEAGADTTGLLKADFSKAPYYFYFGGDLAKENKHFLDQALQLIRDSKFPVAKKIKPKITQAGYEIPKEDIQIVFRMVSERFMNKNEVVRYKTGKDLELICNIPVLEAAQALFKANPGFAKTFPDFLNSLRMFSPLDQGEINGVQVFPRREFQGYTLLHMAAYYNDNPLMRELIAAGADPNLRDRVGNTPLHYTVRGEAFDSANYLASIQSLIDAGVNINAVNDRRESALFLSTGRFDLDLNLIKMFMGKGADMTVKNSEGKTLVDVLNISRRTAFEYKADYPIVLQEYNELIATLGSKGIKPGIVRFNEISGEINFDNSGPDENTPLSKAILENNKNKVEDLIKSGANVNEPCRGGGPLMTAVYTGNLEIAKLLVESGANIHFTIRRQTIISAALSQGRDDLVDPLIKLGAKPTSSDLYSMMSRSSLSQKGQETLQGLLDQGISPNVCNEEGNSLLYEAAWRGSPEAVEILVRNGARVDYCSQDPREIARQENKKEILELLDAQPETGRSIRGLLEDIRHKTPDCRSD